MFHRWKKSSRESWSLQTYTYIYIYPIYISYIYIIYISYIYIHITPFGNQTWLAGQSIKKHGNNMDLHWVVTRRRHASDGRVRSITVCERCMEVAKMCIPFPPIMYIVYMHIYIYIFICIDVSFPPTSLYLSLKCLFGGPDLSAMEQRSCCTRYGWYQAWVDEQSHTYVDPCWNFCFESAIQYRGCYMSAAVFPKLFIDPLG
jgi:hypothetical protein